MGLSITMSNRFSRSDKNIGREENIQKKKKSRPNSHKSIKKYEEFICLHHNKKKFIAHIILSTQLTDENSNSN